MSKGWGYQLICCIGCASFLAISYLQQQLKQSKQKLSILEEKIIEMSRRFNEQDKELVKITKLRESERQGRTTVERKLRDTINQQQSNSGYSLDAIGYVESCFKDRRGTPRQGLLVADARGRITLKKQLPMESLQNLKEFSHIWVIFVFHENSNASKNAMKQTVVAKVAPPRLEGKRVGLFSTRTPHRPNPIGLSVVRVDSIEGRTICISGHDLVDGTPILDIKPYVSNDHLSEFQCPSWVSEDSTPKRPVVFEERAREGITDLLHRKVIKFYSTLDEFLRAVSQVLVLDIRSVHQGRGKANQNVYKMRLDAVNIEFVTEESCIRVLQCYPFEMN